MATGKISLVEVSPRDGLQNDPVMVSTADKLSLIRRAADAGLRRIEVTSFVNPARVPQMGDAAEVMAGAGAQDVAAATACSALALNLKGFERAVAAGCREVTFAVVATETFNHRNQGASVEETLRQWAEIAAAARVAGVSTCLVIGASFGCPFEGEVSAGQVLAIVEKVLASPPDELAFADTIGCGVPVQVRQLLAGARALAPGLPLRCHFHDTRNTGIANALAAVEAGVDALDASIGGIGGCPFAPAATGNIATEDLVYMLERMGIPTGVDLDRVIATARWLAALLGRPVPAALTRAGGFPRAA
jgi:hydroxymethylglutaryl-CoA lyase